MTMAVTYLGSGHELASRSLLGLGARAINSDYTKSKGA